MGRCESQQLAEQNTSLMRPELQVETEQRITLPPTAIGLRHIEQTKAGAGIDVNVTGRREGDEINLLLSCAFRDT